MNPRDCLTDAQIDLIVGSIKNSCEVYRSIQEKSSDFLFEPYTRMRSRQKITSFVLSGFADKNFQQSEFEVFVKQYGINQAQPELVTNRSIVQIYGNTSGFHNRCIEERCAMYGSDLHSELTFLIIAFDADNAGNLHSIEARSMKSNGSIDQRAILFSS